MASSPTSRSLDYCRKQGWAFDIWERRITTKIKRDGFGFIDMVALVPAGEWWEGEGVLPAQALAIQVTSGSNHAARRAKVLANPNAPLWLATLGRIEIWSWSKKGKRGERKTWQLRRDPVTWADVTAPSGR